MGIDSFAIVGAGLAGCECALALERAGFKVTVYEQKPEYKSPAHASDHLAELVCSNSFRSDEPTSAVGLLKEEMRVLGSAIMETAGQCRVPAGKALAVDREEFSSRLTNMVAGRPNIRIEHRRVESLDDPCLAGHGNLGVIIAAGPMVAEGLAQSLASATGADNCYFYDAIAPIVWTDSLDMDIVFRASRHDPEAEGDYLNCPMNREEYNSFHEALIRGQTYRVREFEDERHFEGCMPIEALAARGPRTLSFGPMKPVGLADPRTGRRPWAVLQLRPEKANMETCNLVGCQTKLLQPEQKRIFRMVPGLENAEFARYGSMHRNTFVNAPRVLAADLSLVCRPGVYLAGQIAGVEGYVESAATGLWLARLLISRRGGRELQAPPPETALGALLAHLRRPVKNFQPSNVTFGLMPELDAGVKKKERKLIYSRRAREKFATWMKSNRVNSAV